MYELTVRSKFSAAHRLCGYPGDCSRLHGHTWTIEVKVIGETLNTLGMLIDFKDIKKRLAVITEKLDHHYLNEVPELAEQKVNPTAENLSYYIYKALEGPIGTNLGVRLKEISVWESPDAYATYREE